MLIQTKSLHDSIKYVEMITAEHNLTNELILKLRKGSAFYVCEFFIGLH